MRALSRSPLMQHSWSDAAAVDADTPAGYRPAMVRPGLFLASLACAGCSIQNPLFELAPETSTGTGAMTEATSGPTGGPTTAATTDLTSGGPTTRT